MLFLSRLHFKKGLDLLALAFIRVAAADKDLHLVVAGADNGAKDSFVRDIDAAGLADRVHVVGPLYGAVKLSAYRNATCFCLPSRQEGFSLAVTEALACGTPVVITQDTHFPEAAQAGAGIETNLDPAVIADAVLKITRAPLEVQEVMGMAGRRLVQQRFTWPRIAGMTLNLYASIEKKRRQAILAASWTEAKRVLVPALRAAGLAVTWFITDMTIGR
jgi:glycosyltransferase involved in cell wall biosynthesis